jgi:hypothetical protein
VDYIEDFRRRCEEAYAPFNTAEGYCQRNHAYSEDEPCYRVVVEEYRAQTADMISNFFTTVRSKVADESTRLKAGKPESTRSHLIHQPQSEMMRWSLTQEERIADLSMKINLLPFGRLHHT